MLYDDEQRQMVYCKAIIRIYSRQQRLQTWQIWERIIPSKGKQPLKKELFQRFGNQERQHEQEIL